MVAFNRAGWLVIVVTNQSGIGRGYYTEDDMHALHAHMCQDLLEVGGRIDAFYHAPQHPDAKLDAYRHPDPPDRKPNPGMIVKALAEWPINREASIRPRLTGRLYASPVSFGITDANSSMRAGMVRSPPGWGAKRDKR